MDFIGKGIVKKAFDEHLIYLFNSKPEVLKFVRNHERKNLCIENLINEIELMETKQPALLKKDHLELLGAEYARMFADAALKHEHEQQMNYLEKQQKIDEANIIKETLDMFESEDNSQVLDNGNQIKTN